MLDQAKASVALGATISLDELDRRRPLTDEDTAIADEYLAVLDRLEAEQDAEVIDDQARLYKAILIAARHLRDGRTLAEWTGHTGIPEADIRAAAVALQAIGVETQRPTARAVNVAEPHGPDLWVANPRRCAATILPPYEQDGLCDVRPEHTKRTG